MINKIILKNKLILFAILIGFVVRIISSFLYGTADMEWWKAYGAYSVHHGFVNIYGQDDNRIVSLYKKGFSVKEIIDKTQRIIPYEPYHTSYTEYPYHQPPLYIYSIAVSSWLYSLVSPEIPNNRLFNFFMNIEPIISSLAISVVISRVVWAIRNKHDGIIAGLLYWIHPLVILNSPIQGYRDPMMALFSLISVYFLYKRNLNLSLVFLICSALVKPQGILIAPVVIATGLTLFSLRKNCIAWFYGIFTAVIISFPFIVNHYGLSMILGVSTISKSTMYLSGTPNMWLILQYVITAWQNTHHIYSFIVQLITQPFSHVLIEGISKRIGFNIELIGFILFSVFTILNIYYLYKQLKQGRIKNIFLFSFLQIYGYTQLRVGVQINHYFSLVPLFTVCFFMFPKIRKRYTMVCIILFLYDLAFYGLGRDVPGAYKAMEQIHIMWIIVPVSLFNMLLFSGLCQKTWININKAKGEKEL